MSGTQRRERAAKGQDESDALVSHLMWSEKYRPQVLKDIVNQQDIVKGITNLIKTPDLPHMLFSGPAGVGKTTAAICIAKDLLGQDWERNTLLLNASDERGIKMVRERVKGFAAWSSPTGEDVVKRLFKFVILDEADEMTFDAQTALRTIIEQSAVNTRFILICNYLSQIIEPLQSRCVVFRFSRLSKEDVITHLRKICDQEQAKCDDKALALIYEATGGDMRYSINVLQAAAGLGSVNIENVNSAVGLSGKSKVADVLKLALSGKFNDARVKLLELTQVYGMSETDFMKYANQEAYDLKIEKPDEFAALMAEYDYRLISGAHPEIQLTSLLAQLGRLGRKSAST